MQIPPTSPAVQPTATQPAASNNSVISSDFKTFLNMLTVQMKNQDPLDPIKSEDYAVQLATFSGVEQQVKTNDLISQMTITLAPNPPVVADRVDLIVRDDQGNEVQRSTIPVSADPIPWAGVDADGTPFPTGLYTFEIESSANGQVIENAPVDVYATIIEARTQGGQTILVTNGGELFPATSVTALRNPSLAT